MDWRKGAAAPDYFAAAKNVKICGFKISEFAYENKMDSRLVHCIGHSLGMRFFGILKCIDKRKF